MFIPAPFGSTIQVTNLATFLVNSSATAVLPPTAPACTIFIPLTCRDLSKTAPMPLSAINASALYKLGAT